MGPMRRRTTSLSKSGRCLKLGVRQVRLAVGIFGEGRTTWLRGGAHGVMVGVHNCRHVARQNRQDFFAS